MSEREQLRERLAALMPWGDVGSFDAVDAILAEIEAAGYVLMERGRAERLIAECKETLEGIYPEGAMYLQPGDLDPLEGGE